MIPCQLSKGDATHRSLGQLDRFIFNKCMQLKQKVKFDQLYHFLVTDTLKEKRSHLHV